MHQAVEWFLSYQPLGLRSFLILDSLKRHVILMTSVKNLDFFTFPVFCTHFYMVFSNMGRY